MFEQTPRKVAKTKRKRPEPLAELSTNIPRGGRRRSTNAGKGAKAKLFFGSESSSQLAPSLGGFGHSHDIFRDIDGGTCTPFPPSVLLPH